VPSFDASPAVAVAIPCYNEAAAIATVIAHWRNALPEAEIIVFDNNSTDGTGAIARGLGVRVEPVIPQGKGHAVRAAFALLADRLAVILVDGDGTYPAEAATALLEPILEGRADMVVGRREPIAEAGAMTPVRGLGNLLIRSAFRILMGRAPGDLLSGYRVFSRRFLQTTVLQSAGFEIETELATQAVARGLRVVAVAVPYRPRIAGSVSKLRAFRDGVRILRMIIVQSFRLRPWRPAGLVGGCVALGALLLRSWLAGYCALAALLASLTLWLLPRRV
jgi:glycosyltransferase involved in cell wall biosynthesis